MKLYRNMEILRSQKLHHKSNGEMTFNNRIPVQTNTAFDECASKVNIKDGVCHRHRTFSLSYLFSMKPQTSSMFPKEMTINVIHKKRNSTQCNDNKTSNLHAKNTVSHTVSTVKRTQNKKVITRNLSDKVYNLVNKLSKTCEQYRSSKLWNCYEIIQKKHMHESGNLVSSYKSNRNFEKCSKTGSPQVTKMNSNNKYNELTIFNKPNLDKTKINEGVNVISNADTANNIKTRNTASMIIKEDGQSNMSYIKKLQNSIQRLEILYRNFYPINTKKQLNMKGVKTMTEGMNKMPDFQPLCHVLKRSLDKPRVVKIGSQYLKRIKDGESLEPIIDLGNIYETNSNLNLTSNKNEKVNKDRKELIVIMKPAKVENEMHFRNTEKNMLTQSSTFLNEKIKEIDVIRQKNAELIKQVRERIQRNKTSQTMKHRDHKPKKNFHKNEPPIGYEKNSAENIEVNKIPHVIKVNKYNKSQTKVRSNKYFDQFDKTRSHDIINKLVKFSPLSILQDLFNKRSQRLVASTSVDSILQRSSATKSVLSTLASTCNKLKSDSNTLKKSVSLTTQPKSSSSLVEKKQSKSISTENQTDQNIRLVTLLKHPNIEPHVLEKMRRCSIEGLQKLFNHKQQQIKMNREQYQFPGTRPRTDMFHRLKSNVRLNRKLLQRMKRRASKMAVSKSTSDSSYTDNRNSQENLLTRPQKNRKDDWLNYKISMTGNYHDSQHFEEPVSNQYDHPVNSMNKFAMEQECINQIKTCDNIKFKEKLHFDIKKMNSKWATNKFKTCSSYGTRRTSDINKKNSEEFNQEPKVIITFKNHNFKCEQQEQWLDEENKQRKIKQLLEKEERVRNKFLSDFINTKPTGLNEEDFHKQRIEQKERMMQEMFRNIKLPLLQRKPYKVNEIVQMSTGNQTRKCDINRIKYNDGNRQPRPNSNISIIDKIAADVSPNLSDESTDKAFQNKIIRLTLLKKSLHELKEQESKINKTLESMNALDVSVKENQNYLVETRLKNLTDYSSSTKMNNTSISSLANDSTTQPSVVKTYSVTVSTKEPNMTPPSWTQEPEQLLSLLKNEYKEDYRMHLFEYIKENQKETVVLKNYMKPPMNTPKYPNTDRERYELNKTSTLKKNTHDRIQHMLQKKKQTQNLSRDDTDKMNRFTFEDCKRLVWTRSSSENQPRSKNNDGQIPNVLHNYHKQQSQKYIANNSPRSTLHQKGIDRTVEPASFSSDSLEDSDYWQEKMEYQTAENVHKPTLFKARYKNRKKNDGYYISIQ